MAARLLLDFFGCSWAGREPTASSSQLVDVEPRAGISGLVHQGGPKGLVGTRGHCPSSQPLQVIPLRHQVLHSCRTLGSMVLWLTCSGSRCHRWHHWGAAGWWAGLARPEWGKGTAAACCDALLGWVTRLWGCQVGLVPGVLGGGGRLLDASWPTYSCTSGCWAPHLPRTPFTDVSTQGQGVRPLGLRDLPALQV